MADTETNIDPREIAKFDAVAARWWDPSGDFRTLHHINPVRVDYVAARAGLAGKRVLDIGCGGGILSESLAARGAVVTGIDAAESALMVARLHQAESGAHVEYVHSAPEEFAQQHSDEFDIVTCMELLEHVPNPAGVIAACARVLRPGGHAFFSTINRSPKGYLFAVLGAEYVLGLLPKGTHDYSRFIRPSELAAWVRSAGLRVESIDGMSYNPITRQCALTHNLGVNYLVHARREDA